MDNPTAAIVIIGREILSGRTLDTNTNTNYIAKRLVEVGINLKEARIMDDSCQAISVAINDVKTKYDYIFTTGGIGPTHDDMTTQAIAEAFGTPVELNKEAYALIKYFYNQLGQELNPAREKMAYLPRGSSLINNPVSTAPGFSLGNVYVLPGVPNIMQAMLEQLLPSLKHGTPIQSKHIDFMAGESLIAVELELMQNNYPEIEISSYPFKVGEDHATSIVLRSYNLNNLEEVYQKLYSLVKSFTA